MDVARLDSLDHARSLVECTYAVYGLTFHRDWLYSPEELLELNRRGDVRSLLAIEDGRVVGHLGLIRPHWEVRRDGAPITDAALREVGLSIVHPDFQGRGIQAQLGAAAFQLLVEEDAHGAYMKCVTHHTRSQRGAMRFGGVPVGLSLGSIPRYVVYEGEHSEPGQPISTLGFYLPFKPLPERPCWLPSGQDWVEAALQQTRVPRHMPGPMEVVGPTDLEVRWQGDRQLAQIFVLSAGVDLVERLRDRLRWLVGGHIAHVSVFLPTDAPAVGGVGPQLAELGLFTCGVIPGFFAGSRDALVLQAMAFSELAPDGVQVVGSAQALRDRVLDDWHGARGRLLRLLDTERRGRVRVSVAAEEPREAC